MKQQTDPHPTAQSGGRMRFASVLVLAACAAAARPLAAQSGAGSAKAAPSGVAVSATPVIITLGGALGQASAIEVHNEGKTQAQLRFYPGDFEQDVNGGYTFSPVGAGAHSCGRSLSVFPEGAVLLAGERQQIRVRLESGAPVCWAMVFVETLPQGRGMVRVAQRIAVKVLNVPAGASVAGQLGTVEARVAPGDTVRVRALFQNTGEAPLQIKGRVEIRDYAGKVYAQAEFGPVGSLPGRARAVNVAIPVRLRRGDYVAVPIVDFGGDYLAGGQGILHVR